MHVVEHSPISITAKNIKISITECCRVKIPFRRRRTSRKINPLPHTSCLAAKVSNPQRADKPLTDVKYVDIIEIVLPAASSKYNKLTFGDFAHRMTKSRPNKIRTADGLV